MIGEGEDTRRATHVSHTGVGATLPSSALLDRRNSGAGNQGRCQFVFKQYKINSYTYLLSLEII